MRRALWILCGLLLVSRSSTAWAVVNFAVNSSGDASDEFHGDGLCVTSTPGECTLRAAVEEANLSGGGTITVPTLFITLTQGPIAIRKSMTIVGAGMKKTVISGNGVFQIFNVGTNPNATAVAATISDMTLRDGIVTDIGGAVFAGAGATLTVARCFFTNNYAFVFGGALGCGGSVSDTYLVVRDSVFEKNYTTQEFSRGGAVAALQCNLSMTGTTIEQNGADIGGGLWVGAGEQRISNSTISLNTSQKSGGGLEAGGSAEPTNLVLYSTTVASNHANTVGGGGISVSQGAFISLRNTILAYNVVGSGFIVTSDCKGALSGSNLILTSVASCTVTGSFTIVNPLLGPLQDNGGLGRSHALLAGSPAIDGGPLGGCPSATGFLATDVRGAERVVGAKCDIGSYEKTPCGDVNGDGAMDVTDVFFLINYLFAGGPLPPGLANVNGDGAVTVGDVFSLINYLFAGGAAPNCPGT
jgi:hypothetical protein